MKFAESNPVRLDAANRCQTRSVTVVVATYRRPETLQRLLESLLKVEHLNEIIIVDNGGDSATRQIAESSALPVRYIDPRRNLNCGGGVTRGLEEGLRNRDASHFWIFDDDAVAHPGALKGLLEAMETCAADVAVPIILTEAGKIGWIPGLLENRPWQFIKKAKNITQIDYLEAMGPAPVPFSWAPWPTILVTRRAIETVGCPKDVFWLTVEDLEFTLRLTNRFKGIFVPTVTCGHYPPGASRPELSHQAHYLRFCLMLQNLSYAVVHLRHARRALKHLPGNYRRFFRTFGCSRETLSDASRAFWWGCICGKPAGITGYQAFKERLLNLDR